MTGSSSLLQAPTASTTPLLSAVIVPRLAVRHGVTWGLESSCLFPSFMLPNHGAQQGDPGHTSASPSSPCFLSCGSSSSRSPLVSPVGTQPETEVKGVVEAATTVASEPPAGWMVALWWTKQSMSGKLRFQRSTPHAAAVRLFLPSNNNKSIADSNMLIIFLNRK